MIESLIPAASTYAGDIDNLFSLIFWMVCFWFILCEAALFWLIWRFRKQEGVATQYVTGETKAEKRWVTWPHLLVLVCDVFIISGAVKVWNDVKLVMPPPMETVRVVGQQWAWTFVHPGPDGELDTADDIAKINELHVKVGTVYHYKLESTDVLHSFSVPVFRLKQDAIPGRIITGWFEPTKTGEWDIQCAEICGIGHGLMGGRIFIETPEQHANWLAEQGGVSIAALAPQVQE